jgi:abortive infection bacteriophage resistance protein
MLTPRSYFLKTNQKKSYNKPFLNIQQQIEKLKSRGMIFEDEQFATKQLENINYYRLSGYWLIYQKNNINHLFKENTTFKKVLNIYLFDRALRLLFLEAIERIEVSIRTRFAYILSKKYGSHFHLKPELFYCPIKYSQTLVKINSEVYRSKEICITHFKKNYKEKLPPIWSSIELMTLGQVSNWFENIKFRQDKQQIAKYYNLDEKVLSSFLHHLTIIRNISAHHSRLWNKKIPLDFVLPKKPIELNTKMNDTKKKYLYNTIMMIDHILNQIDNKNTWLEKIEELIKEHNIEKERMGY